MEKSDSSYGCQRMWHSKLSVRDLLPAGWAGGGSANLVLVSDQKGAFKSTKRGHFQLFRQNGHVLRHPQPRPHVTGGRGPPWWICPQTHQPTGKMPSIPDGQSSPRKGESCGPFMGLGWFLDTLEGSVAMPIISGSKVWWGSDPCWPVILGEEESKSRSLTAPPHSHPICSGI